MGKHFTPRVYSTSRRRRWKKYIRYVKPNITVEIKDSCSIPIMPNKAALLRAVCNPIDDVPIIEGCSIQRGADGVIHHLYSRITDKHGTRDLPPPSNLVLIKDGTHFKEVFGEPCKK